MAGSDVDAQETKVAEPIRSIGPYRVVRQLGKGGMGSVYLARDPVLERDVVIKVLHPYLADDPIFLQRFVQEANHAASVNHPSVIRIIKVEPDHTPPYMVMEFFDGETLDRRVARAGPLPHQLGLAVARHIALALREAAKQGLIHRDIKPSNIMVDQDGFVKVLDFGIAKSTQKDLKLTESGAIVGTPYFMAPEVLKGMPSDIRSDMFSLGVTLFFAMTGKYPYEGRNVAELAVRMHLTETQPNPLSVNPEMQAGAASLIRRLMAFSREERFADYDAVITAIEGAMSSDMPPTRRPSTMRWVYAAALLTGAAAAGGALYVHWNRGKPNGEESSASSSGITQEQMAGTLSAPVGPPDAQPEQAAPAVGVPAEQRMTPPTGAAPALVSLSYDFSNDERLAADWEVAPIGGVMRRTDEPGWHWENGAMMSAPRSLLILRKLLRGDRRLELAFDLIEPGRSFLVADLFSDPSEPRGFSITARDGSGEIRPIGHPSATPLAASPQSRRQGTVHLTVEIKRGELSMTFDDSTPVRIRAEAAGAGGLAIVAPNGPVRLHSVVIKAAEITDDPDASMRHRLGKAQKKGEAPGRWGGKPGTPPRDRTMPEKDDGPI